VRPVILFDGVCHLCNWFVQFVLRRDPAGQFDFAPLQSEYARERLGTLHLESVVLLEDGQVFHAEKAALRILLRLQNPWPAVARIAGWLPGPLVAWIYRVVAQNRYKLFGKDEICALPRTEWKDRFL
jgi:predicted DCC family thiol-disulfide oxidoreductase YuxK